MVGVLAVLIVSAFSLSVFDRYLLNSPSLAAVISAVLVDLTNGDRSANALSGLTVSSVLTAAAQAKANDMAANGYFAHVSPTGKDSWYWFKAEGYTFLYAGENLAVDFSDSTDVEHAWMNSPSHRENILNGHFTEIGIATAQGTFEGHPTTFVVQMFGTPVAKAAVSAPVRTLTSPKEPTAPALATTEPAPRSSVVASATEPAHVVLGEEAGSVTATRASWWQYLIASPKTALKYVYGAVALILIGLLAYVTEFEFHRRHLRHASAATLLVVLMLGLFAIASFMFFTTPVIAAL